MSKLCCPLCGRQEIRLVHKESEWNIVKCLSCSFVFVNPIPDDIALRCHYQQYLPSEENRIRDWCRMMSGVFSRSLDVIGKENGSHHGKLLDIGCGYGFFLDLAHKKGWEVYGVEPCDHARAYAAKKGILVDSENLFERAYNDELFDVVTLFYVLEHLPDPLRYLKEINRILKPGGLLLIRVPHTTPIVRLLKIFAIANKLYDVPSHLSDFSPRTIALALEKTGFNEIHTFPGGATRPQAIGQRLISKSSGALAEALYKISGKTLLLPGISKTTIARKMK